MKIVRRSFCSLLAALLPVFVIAQQNTVTPVALNKIGDNIYEVKGGRGANGGAFIGKSGVLLIDSKMDKESVDQTLTEIRKLTDKPIRFLVNTHSDGDHVFGNRFLPESVVFVAHENCRKEFFHPGRNGEPSSWNARSWHLIFLRLPSTTKWICILMIRKWSCGILGLGIQQEI